MKKILLSAALIAATVFTLSAQEKGDFAVGGALGVSGGSSSSTTTVSAAGNSATTTSKSSSPVGFMLNPMFSYFVIDNLELSAGLEYNMTRAWSGDGDSKSYSTDNLAEFVFGVNYYVNLADNRFFYTPGVRFGLGGGSYIYDPAGDADNVTTKRPFAFSFTANLGKFEFKALDCLGVYVNLLDLRVDYYTHESATDYDKTHSTDFTAGLNYGLSAGVKYYF